MIQKGTVGTVMLVDTIANISRQLKVLCVI